MKLFRWFKKMRWFGGKKRAYRLYLEQDQMALAGRLAERVGKPLHVLVAESLSYIFEELGMSREKCERMKNEAIAFANGYPVEISKASETHRRSRLSQLFRRERN
jgi:hypothetical protein